MGGLAFSNSGPNGSPLNVPRMPTTIYKSQVAEIQSKLLTIFRNVVVPHEAPGKLDHGDIDFLVEGTLVPWTPDSIKKTIGATHFATNGVIYSYAVPYADAPDQYVQVDIERSPGNGTADSEELFEWTKFMKSYSDLLQIIGICHRSLGLTCNDKGLHLSIVEIEPYDKKKALIFLTRKPCEVMDFYGFDYEKYQAGFESETDLFQWVSSGRFFARSIFENRKEKANDRSRLKKRPMYRRFVEEFIPSHPQVGIHDKTWTRGEVLDSALVTFDKRSQYDGMVAKHIVGEKEDAFWGRIRKIQSFPTGKTSLKTTIRGLKRFVRFDDAGCPFLLSTPFEKNDIPMWMSVVKDEDLVLAWVSENWKKAKTLEESCPVAQSV